MNSEVLKLGVVGCAELYRLGRFEYMVKPFKGPLLAFRHRYTSVVVALAEDGTRFDNMGFLAPDTQEENWSAQLEATEATVIGSPISPRGMHQADFVAGDAQPLGAQAEKE